jgi:hypothetical protein
VGELRAYTALVWLLGNVGGGMGGVTVEKYLEEAKRVFD